MGMDNKNGPYPTTQLVFYVNGRKITEDNADPEETLAHFLRVKLQLTGTKIGCNQGGCGACTVMLSSYDNQSKTIVHSAINSCLRLLVTLHGHAITTTEGIGSIRDGMHPVQERIAKSHGSQCGYCTPGFVMSMYVLLRNNIQPTQTEMVQALEGNLCRCTGYRPIIDGFKSFCKGPGETGRCCMDKDEENKNEKVDAKLFDVNNFKPYDPSQDIIFPPELQVNREYHNKMVVFRSNKVTWFRPSNLQELLEVMKKFPDGQIVGGNVQIGLNIKFENQTYPTLIATSHVQEMYGHVIEGNGLRIGAGTSITKLVNILNEAVNSLPEYKTRNFKAIADIMKWFGGEQIRNAATLGGNIANPRLTSDVNPVLIAAEAILEILSSDGTKRTYPIRNNFYPSKKKTLLKGNEVILNVFIPCTKSNENYCSYRDIKQHASCAGMKVVFKDGTDIVEDLILCYGGVAPFTFQAKTTAAKAIGSHWNKALLETVTNQLDKEIQIPSDIRLKDFKKALVLSYFYKFYQTVLQGLQGIAKAQPVTASGITASTELEKLPSKSIQIFEEVAAGQMPDDPIGRPVRGMTADQQATGESKFCDDIPTVTGELHIGLVYSERAHAKIVSVDTSEALATPGVHCYVDHNDIPGSTTYESAGVTANVFAMDTVEAFGHVIGAIAAESKSIAMKAAKLVKVTYEDLPPTLTIKDAIKAELFIGGTETVEDGDLEKGFKGAKHTIEGEYHIGGQDHFFMETHVCLARPHPSDSQMEVFCSTQDASTTQDFIANLLGIPAHKVVLRVKRLGGGFGGKINFSPVIAPAILAAWKTRRPARGMLERNEDIAYGGNRCPWLVKYKLGVNSDGKVLAEDVNIYCNGGYKEHGSTSETLIGVLNADNAYNIPNVQITGQTCKTNLPAFTMMRGAGYPQGIIVSEFIMSHVAKELGIPEDKVREVNLYKEGDLTPYGQEVNSAHMLKRCWEECKKHSDYDKKRLEIDDFNRKNHFKKKGIAITPIKKGLGTMETAYLQAGALVHVYLDGSVILFHSGVEMGQGINTKLRQIASRELHLPMERIHIEETSTNHVPNQTCTGSSIVTDLVGPAVKDACETIYGRLKPYMNAEPDTKWEDWVSAAYMDRVNLSANGFSKNLRVDFDETTKRGMQHIYFVYGACCSVVEVDCLTGHHKVTKSDLVVDVGNSLNPALDIGQIEGAFMMGYGYHLMEEITFSPNGRPNATGPYDYKIPTVNDLPEEFNVYLLKGSYNDKVIYGSQGVGEPSLSLALSIFFAVKDAIYSARSDSGTNGYFALTPPATAAQIRIACGDVTKSA